MYLGAVPLAEIYPLVTARTLARLFTYEVGEDVERGTVVSVNLGRRRVRGVVVDVGVEAPPGVEIATAGAVVDRVPPRSSSSRSGSRTTTDPRRHARLPWSHLMRLHGAASGARRRSATCSKESQSRRR